MLSYNKLEGQMVSYSSVIDKCFYTKINSVCLSLMSVHVIKVLASSWFPENIISIFIV